MGSRRRLSNLFFEVLGAGDRNPRAVTLHRQTQGDRQTLLAGSTRDIQLVAVIAHSS